MSQSFFLDRVSGWHTLYPLTKIAVAFAIIVSAFSVRWFFISIALFVLVILPLAIWAKHSREILRSSLLAVVPVAISLILVQGFFYPGAQDVLWQIGPFALKREGLEFAFVTGTRLVVIAGAILLVVYSTHPADLALSLVRAGAPSSLAYVIVAAIQLLPEMQAQAIGILNAQQARGLETEGSLRVRIAAFVPLLAPLIYGALENVQERALALDARAFRAPRPKTSWRELRDTPFQQIFRIALVVLSILLIVYALVSPFLSR